MPRNSLAFLSSVFVKYLPVGFGFYTSLYGTCDSLLFYILLF